MVRKEQVPPATPRPLTVSQNGTPEASITDIQLEIVQENISNPDRCELPLLGYCRSPRSIRCLRGDFSTNHKLEEGHTWNVSIP